MDNTSKFCRICFETEELPENKLFSPCKCSGSSKYIHEKCLEKWIDVNFSNIEIKEKCTVCNYKYQYLHVKDRRITTIFLNRFTKKYIFPSSVIIYMIFCFLDAKYCYQNKMRRMFTITLNCSDFIGISILSLYFIWIIYLTLFYGLPRLGTKYWLGYSIKLTVKFIVLSFLIVVLYPIGVFLVFVILTCILRCMFWEEIKNYNNLNKKIKSYSVEV